jgi:hypothetical protein
MLTATAASSRTTPAAVEFALLQSWLASGSALQLPLHEIECQQQDKGREMQRLLLQTDLQQRDNGDVGPALRLQQQDGELLYSDRRMGTRSLTTVFGTVELVRMGYSLRRAKIPYFRIYDLRSTYATRFSAGGVADEWVTQLLRQGDAKVFKKYSQMNLQMKREL